MNSGFGIWDATCVADHDEWLAHWRDWPAREVAAHPAYAQLFADGAHHRPLTAYWKSPAGCVLYPFILRDLSAEPYWQPSLGPCADIVSPYGYGGPFSWGDDRQSVATEFWRHFDQWAAERRVVSEFVRMSLFADSLLPYPGLRVPKLTNVVCDLAPTESELWENVKPKVRRNVKRAEREGVTVVCDERGDTADDFRRLYAATMDRRAATAGYYFADHFFDQLHTGLSGQFAYFHALHNGRAISTELVLISADSAYFFLGGTDSDNFALRPNDLLKYRIMLWAKQRGKKHYVLGGGFAERDGLFEYKQSFAPNGLVPFYAGQRVFDPTIYELLVAQRRLTSNPADAGYFPAYRAA